MNIVYFDTIAGIAGDMTLAAFISAGYPLDELTGELRKLPSRRIRAYRCACASQFH